MFDFVNLATFSLFSNFVNFPNSAIVSETFLSTSFHLFLSHLSNLQIWTFLIKKDLNSFLFFG
jgi:hypothetical protein